MSSSASGNLVSTRSQWLALALVVVWVLTGFLPVQHVTPNVTPIPQSSLSVFVIGNGGLAWFRTSRTGWERPNRLVHAPSKIPFGTLWLDRMFLGRARHSMRPCGRSHFGSCCCPWYPCQRTDAQDITWRSGIGADAVIGAFVRRAATTSGRLPAAAPNAARPQKATPRNAA